MSSFSICDRNQVKLGTKTNSPPLAFGIWESRIIDLNKEELEEIQSLMLTVTSPQGYGDRVGGNHTFPRAVIT